MKKVLFLLFIAVASFTSLKAQEEGLHKIDFRHSANKEALSSITSIKGEACECPLLDCAYMNYERKRVSFSLR